MFGYVDYIAQFQIFILSTEDIKMKNIGGHAGVVAQISVRRIVSSIQLGYLIH